MSPKKSGDLHEYGSWEWARAITKLRGRNVLLPASLQTTTAQHDKGQLGRIRSSHIAMQVERHHFSCLQIAARKSHASSTFSTFFRFSILNHMASNRSMLPHSYNIKTPVVARYGPSKPPELLFTSVFLHHYRYIAVARFWTCGEEKLGILRDPVTRQCVMESCGQWMI